MNQPPNSGMNVPPGYGQTPPGYGQPQGYPQGAPQSYPQSGPVPASGSYMPPPQGRTGFTRQIFNPAMYRQPGSGSWAAASLILSLVSMVFCLGLIAPLPLLIGLVGLVGNKRAKGLAFVGVVLSALQIGGWALLMGTGMYLNFQSEGLAEDAGKPVVAAISEFKNDHKRVPMSLEELVGEGYLPATWEQGLDGINGNVAEHVKGKRWSDFLRYKPGGDSMWKGETGWVDVANNGNADDWADFFGVEAPTEGQTYQTYGLAFVGLDTLWGTTDDSAVNQTPEEPYELTAVWGGDDKTREFAKKRRDMQRMQRQLESKRETLEGAVSKAEKDLEQVEGEVRELMNAKGLASLDAVKKDSKGAGLLKLAGATAKRHDVAKKKLQLVSAKIDDISIQVRLLQNEEEMAKMADSPQEMAELVMLLEETQKVLDDKVSLGDLDTKADDEAAAEWFSDKFK